MYKNQYNKIKGYKKRKRGVITIKNIFIVIALLLVAISIAYSYWGTTLKISGTVIAYRQTGSGIIETNDPYDPDNPQEGTHTYNGSDGSPTVTVENGEVTSYELSDTGENGVAISSGNSIDTGLVAFDGNAFRVEMVFRMNPSNNSGKYVLTALENVSSSRYAGFVFYCFNSSTFYLNASTSSSISSASFGTRINSSDPWKVSSGEQTFTLVLEYTPSPTKEVYIEFSPIKKGKSPYRKTSEYFPASLNNATITVGGSRN